VSEVLGLYTAVRGNGLNPMRKRALNGHPDKPGLQRPRSFIHGIIGLLFAPIGLLAVLIEYSLPVVVIVAMVTLERPWWQVGLIGFPAWMLYKGMVQPLLMNGAAMVTIWSCELPWRASKPPRVDRPLADGFVALLASAPIVTYSVVFFFAVGAALVLGLPRIPALVGLGILTMATRLVLATRQSRAADRAKIVLLRAFRDHVTQWSLAGLTPALSAYGAVETLNDDSLGDPSNGPPNPENVPLGEVTRVPTEGDPWQTVVRRLMQEADCIVIDVTEPSPAVGWEIGCAWHCAVSSAIILVCQPQALMPRLGDHPLFARLISNMVQHRERAEAERILRSINPPLVYTNDLTNLVFCLRLYWRMRSVSRRR
jgi:hypothetical protein